MQGSSSPVRDPGSYRDPSGFVYWADGSLYRQVNRAFADRWDDLSASGLLGDLQSAGLLVPHELVSPALAADPNSAHVVIRPDPIDFISYPFEWSFGELKDAALLTLDIQERAVRSGYTLRDASAFNIQFRRGRPILIDTLSLERAVPGAPWLAYRQFCEHFIAPLALMAYRDARAGQFLRDFLDGIPLDFATHFLPGRTKLSTGLGTHLHLHDRAQRRQGGPGGTPHRQRARIGATRQAALLDSLRRTVEKLRWNPEGTTWADYAEHTSYSAEASYEKDRLVRQMLVEAGGSVVWDLGANTGRFSAIAAELDRRVIAWDSDVAATERHYRSVRRQGEQRILPLFQDLLNPTPRLGWGLAERQSFVDRANADVVLALALVHHLALGRNVPLDMIANFLATLGPDLIIEFVPKEDPMVQGMLADRQDVFPDYAVAGFRSAFGRLFHLVAESGITGTSRTLYRFRRRDTF